MDFSQFLLTESYTVSPYKICVASFICAYLERRHIVDISQSTSWSPSFLDINVHGHLTYKLIMSMDCSFDELCHRIKNGSNNSAAPEVFNLFNSTINQLRRFEIQHFYDFFDMIRSLVQGKFSFSDQDKRKMKFSDDLDIDSMSSYNQIHKMSLVGIFLRKLIIHYEHLSYCEASTLFDQLQHYLKNSSGSNDINSIDDERDESQSEANTADDKEIGSINDLASQLNPKIIDKIEEQLKLPQFSKLSTQNQFVFSLNLYNLLNKARDPIKNLRKMNFSKRKLSDLENSKHEQSESMEIDDYLTTATPKCSKNIIVDNSDASSIAMDLDITLNDDDKSTNNTLFGSIQGLKLNQKFGSNLKQDLNHSITKQIQNDRKVRIYDTSQHYLVKQIYKIQFNEKSTPSPQQVMRYIRSKYSQHNSFYYFRFITFNYLANLNLIRDQNTGQADFSMNNGGSIPIVMASDNRNNIHNHNQITNGPTVGNNVGINAGQISTISGGINVGSGGNSIPTSVTIDSLDKKYKSLFRSINFFNDIEYLKYNNALRVNNFTLARKYFFDYFDLKKPSFEPDSDFGPNSNNSSSNGNSWPMPINHTNHINTHTNANTNNVHNNLPQRNDVGNAGAGQAGHHHPDRHNHHIRATNDSSGRNGLSDMTNGRSTMMLNSNSSNYCWSSLNLAMMYAHFHYYSLAYDALVDCLSLAREKRDERCLQYAMLWILQISQHLDHSKTSQQILDGMAKQKNYPKVYADLDLMENIIGLILTNQLTLPYISAKAFLHLYRVQYLKPNPFVSEQFSLSDAMVSAYGGQFTRPPFLPQSLYLAIKCNLFDVLGETFSTYSAILNAYGQTHFASLLAKLWLRLDIIETIMEEKIFFLDENTSIAARNIAHYLWFVRGDHNGALELLKKIQQCLSPYNQRSKQILERALNELKFEYHLNRCEWNDAYKCLNLIRCIDRTRSYLMLAELKRRQNQPLIALECLDLIVAKPGGCKPPQSNSSVSQLCGTSFFRPNVFQNDIAEKSCLEDEDNEENEISVVVRKVKKKSLPKKSCLPRSMDSQDFMADIWEDPSQKPIFLNNYYRANNLSFYERIQPPPPEELEPESERPLVPELDPYASVECQLMRGTILEDLSTLFECVAKSLSYGFKQLECRTLIQIARLQSETYGQHHNAINILEAILHRIYSQGTLQDLATALYVYASIFYRMHCQGSLGKHHSIMINRLVIVSQPRPTVLSDWKTLKPASILIKRSILIREYLQDRKGLYESLKMAALIANEQNNLTERNFYAKRARIIRSTTTG